MTAQAIGAYGEKSVEAELLRLGWIPANVNASVKNAADFDIFALKDGRTVHLRVKACGPGASEFQFGFRPSLVISGANLSNFDFTILVRMGVTRNDDSFYVMPTRVLRDIIGAHQRSYLAQPRRDGAPRKDTGHWTLRLQDLKSGEDRPSYGLAKKWKKYLNNWRSLEGKSKIPS